MMRQKVRVVSLEDKILNRYKTGIEFGARMSI